MSVETVPVLLKIPKDLYMKISEISRGNYRSKQEFILECVRKEIKEEEASA